LYWSGFEHEGDLQTRHASVTIALRYIREADLWTDNASAALGL